MSKILKSSMKKPSKKTKAELGRKNATQRNEVLMVEGIKITHPNRILSATKTISKGKIAKYYDYISELILPHITNRPIVLVRCIDDYNPNHTPECFYQKHYNPSFPKSIYPIEIEEESNRKNPYLFIKNKNGLLSLIQFSTLEIHSWGSSCKNVEQPDRIIFDLDPDPSVPWKTVINTAFLIRERLEAIKLVSFIKTTGGKGLHVVVPIKPQNTWQAIKSFSKQFAQSLAEEYPTLYTINPLKVKRHRKIFIDYLRNARGSLFVAPYSTRAKPGAPISMPLTWEELRILKSPNSFTVSNIQAKIAKRDLDPWEGFFQCRQKLNIETNS